MANQAFNLVMALAAGLLADPNIPDFMKEELQQAMELDVQQFGPKEPQNENDAP